MIGSLCTGYGGLDLAVEAVTGQTTAWVCEYDKHPSTILAQRFPGVPNHHDLTTTDWADVEPVDVLTAGYPCQPFSHAGKRQGTADARHLWPHIAGAVRVLRPRLVVLENVAGHLSLGFGDVLGDLAGLGYDARWGCVRAADVGAPHGRKRVFIVATDTASARRAGTENAGAGRGDEGAGIRGAESERDCGSRTPADTGGGSFAGTAPTGHGLPIATQRGGGTPADASGDGREQGRPEPARLKRGSDAAERGGAAPSDAGGERHGRRENSRTVGRLDGEDAGQTRQRQRPRAIPVHRGGETATHTAGADRGGTESDDLAPTNGRTAEPGERASSDHTWGAYTSAIQHWERITGRPAPAPTERGRKGPRLNPTFVEWMMGLPAGWVTDTGIPRNAQLKALGNGVVPQQAAAAIRWLTEGQAAA